MPYKDPEKRRAYYLRHESQIKAYKKTYRQKHRDRLKAIEKDCKQPYWAIYIGDGGELKCSECGTTEDLVIHHKDLNHFNNDFNNLQCLCGSCHVKLHNKLKSRDEKGRFAKEVITDGRNESV